MAAREVVRLTAENTALETHPARAEDHYRWPEAANEIVLEVFAGAGADTVTVLSQAEEIDGLVRADKKVELAAKGRARILISSTFRSESGRVTVLHSAPSGVRAGAFYLI